MVKEYITRLYIDGEPVTRKSITNISILDDIDFLEFFTIGSCSVKGSQERFLPNGKN